MHDYRLWANWLESSFLEKDLRVLADTKLEISQQHALAAKTTASWAALGKAQLADQGR